MSKNQQMLKHAMASVLTSKANKLRIAGYALKDGDFDTYRSVLNLPSQDIADISAEKESLMRKSNYEKDMLSRSADKELIQYFESNRLAQNPHFIGLEYNRNTYKNLIQEMSIRDKMKLLEQISDPVRSKDEKAQIVVKALMYSPDATNAFVNLVKPGADPLRGVPTMHFEHAEPGEAVDLYIDDLKHFLQNPESDFADTKHNVDAKVRQFLNDLRLEFTPEETENKERFLSHVRHAKNEESLRDVLSHWADFMYDLGREVERQRDDERRKLVTFVDEEPETPSEEKHPEARREGVESIKNPEDADRAKALLKFDTARKNNLKALSEAVTKAEKNIGMFDDASKRKKKGGKPISAIELEGWLRKNKTTFDREVPKFDDLSNEIDMDDAHQALATKARELQQKVNSVLEKGVKGKGLTTPATKHYGKKHDGSDIPFGKFLINGAKLKQNIFSLCYANKKKVNGFPNLRITDNLKAMFTHKKINTKKHQLTDGEKEFLADLCVRAEVSVSDSKAKVLGGSVHLISSIKEGKKRLRVLIGEIGGGNNSTTVQQEASELVNLLLRNKAITTEVAKQITEQILNK